MFTLLGFAFLSMDEDDDSYDGLPFMESAVAAWNAEILRRGSVLRGFDLGVFALILISEYLRSHIGEKRPADRMAGFSRLSLYARSQKTILFFRVVFCSFSALLEKNKSFIHGGILVMHRIGRSSLSRKKLLVQGGL
jgi:hypothetical protein